MQPMRWNGLMFARDGNEIDFLCRAAGNGCLTIMQGTKRGGGTHGPSPSFAITRTPFSRPTHFAGKMLLGHRKGMALRQNSLYRWNAAAQSPLRAATLRVRRPTTAKVVRFFGAAPMSVCSFVPLATGASQLLACPSD